MPLLAIHDKLDDIPEPYRELYTEKNGKYEVTGITGIKTQADVDRVHTSLVKERDDHKSTKDKLAVWGDMNHEETQTKLDRLPELEAAAEGKWDEAKIEEVTTKRVEGVINSRLAPLQRQVVTLTKERDDFKTVNDSLSGEKRTRTIHDSVRKHLTEKQVIVEAHEDALMLADRIFEIREEDGSVVTRDSVGVTPGVGADVWLSEIQEKRPHWWLPSQGGGGKGGPGGGGGGGENPWTHENWNMTAQGEIIKTRGREKADQLAKAAGTSVGGVRPTPPAK